MTSPTLRLPPVPALQRACLALVPVVLIAVGAGALGGGAGVAWVLLGVATALSVATHRVPWTDTLGTTALSIVAGVAGLAAQGKPVQAALVVALVGLAQAPLSRRSPAGGAMLPVLVAVAASTGLRDDPMTAGLALTAGVGTIVATAWVLGLRAPAVPVPAATAWRHAAALAVTSALALGVVVQQQVTHGYWLVLALALVLRPEAEETRSLGRDRILGSVVGLAVGVAAVVLMPLAALLALAAACVVLSAAWGIVGETRRAAACSAPLLVLLGSSGLASPGAALALERMAYTIAGVALAVLAARVLDRIERRGA